MLMKLTPCEMFQTRSISNFFGPWHAKEQIGVARYKKSDYSHKYLLKRSAIAATEVNLC